jgi:hypothetical protein
LTPLVAFIGPKLPQNKSQKKNDTIFNKIKKKQAVGASNRGAFGNIALDDTIKTFINEYIATLVKNTTTLQLDEEERPTAHAIVLDGKMCATSTALVAHGCFLPENIHIPNLYKGETEAKDIQQKGFDGMPVTVSEYVEALFPAAQLFKGRYPPRTTWGDYTHINTGDIVWTLQGSTWYRAVVSKKYNGLTVDCLYERTERHIPTWSPFRVSTAHQRWKPRGDLQAVRRGLSLVYLDYMSVFTATSSKNHRDDVKRLIERVPGPFILCLTSSLMMTVMDKTVDKIIKTVLGGSTKVKQVRLLQQWVYHRHAGIRKMTAKGGSPMLFVSFAVGVDPATLVQWNRRFQHFSKTKHSALSRRCLYIPDTGRPVRQLCDPPKGKVVYGILKRPTGQMKLLLALLAEHFHDRAFKLPAVYALKPTIEQRFTKYKGQKWQAGLRRDIRTLYHRGFLSYNGAYTVLAAGKDYCKYCLFPTPHTHGECKKAKRNVKAFKQAVGMRDKTVRIVTGEEGVVINVDDEQTSDGLNTGKILVDVQMADGSTREVYLQELVVVSEAEKTKDRLRATKATKDRDQ